MKDEIKEILDKLEIVARKHTIEVCEDGSKIETMPANVVDELRLNNYSSKLLLNYITNLQEENKRLNEIVENLTTMTVCGDRKQIKNTAQYKLEIAQDRIDKAIEYITTHSLNVNGEIEDVLEVEECEDLLDILRGETNE